MLFNFDARTINSRIAIVYKSFFLCIVFDYLDYSDYYDNDTGSASFLFTITVTARKRFILKFTYPQTHDAQTTEHIFYPLKFWCAND